MVSVLCLLLLPLTSISQHCELSTAAGTSGSSLWELHCFVLWIVTAACEVLDDNALKR